MKIINKNKLLAGIGSALIATLMLVGVAGPVMANNGNDNKSGKIEKVVSLINSKIRTNTDVHIASNGNANVSGAKVLSVSGSNLVVRASFGSLNMDWTIVTDSNTKIVREKNGVANFSDIKVGDTVHVYGVVDTTVSTPTIKAKVVRDIS